MWKIMPESESHVCDIKHVHQGLQHSFSELSYENNKGAAIFIFKGTLINLPSNPTL
jgi:hypothetical protein